MPERVTMDKHAAYHEARMESLRRRDATPARSVTPALVVALVVLSPWILAAALMVAFLAVGPLLIWAFLNPRPRWRN